MKPIDLKDGYCPHLKRASFTIIPSFWYCGLPNEGNGGASSVSGAHEPCMKADAEVCDLAAKLREQVKP